MAQILDSLPTGVDNPITCCYVNATSKIQIARITNVPNWYFERVVFPGQRLLFETLKHAQLEIHTGMMASAILSDTIPCDRLEVEEAEDGSIRFLDRRQPDDEASDYSAPMPVASVSTAPQALAVALSAD
ncbi:MAG: DUF1830 domain-containing protein [Synechococcales cyanobacterium K44_A2020_017]|jgi:hypothetical protein|uniref:DUF1830 domain-containing protein n=1 Tax=Leptolyngbya sp. CCY15150 TaxID=2767772 RepID=UPI00194E110B|nr:DUF1830 domain-containing protein [Leptolyngbya sp. CCY15150]MBF2090477.1 DUF1830 domain-containing protein [Synechococcales cyanobacterium K32_A2020_035]MBF2094805.1 DUF1830 domain-containing protein [Synechococcales cyanobacterium K44_A2020_017]